MKKFSIMVLIFTVFALGCNDKKKADNKKDFVGDVEAKVEKKAEKLKSDLAAEEVTYENHLSELERLGKQKKELSTKLKSLTARLQKGDKITDVVANEKVVGEIGNVNSQMRRLEKSISEERFKARKVKLTKNIAYNEYQKETSNKEARAYSFAIASYNDRIKKYKDLLESYTNEESILSEISELNKQNKLAISEGKDFDPDSMKRLRVLHKKAALIKKARQDKLPEEPGMLAQEVKGLWKRVGKLASKVDLPDFKMPQYTSRAKKTKIKNLDTLPELSLVDEDGLQQVEEKTSEILNMITVNNNSIAEVENKKKVIPKELEEVGKGLSALYQDLKKVKEQNAVGSEVKIKELEGKIEELNSKKSDIGSRGSEYTRLIEMAQDSTNVNIDDLERLSEVRTYFVTKEEVKIATAKIRKEIDEQKAMSDEQKKMSDDQIEGAEDHIKKLNNALNSYGRSIELGMPMQTLKVHTKAINNLRSPDSVKAKKSKKK